MNSCDVCGADRALLTCAPDGILRCFVCDDKAPDTSAFVPDVMVYGDLGDNPFSDVVYVPYDYSVEELIFD